MHQERPKEKGVYDLVAVVSAKRKLNESDIDRVIEILKQAYTDRLSSICGWLTKDRISLGLNFDATSNFDRDLDKGPHPKAPEADAFRKFWGAKSVLRRFPDGSLLESLQWEGDSVREIAEYALKMHFDQDLKIEFSWTDMSQLFTLPHHQPNPDSPNGAFDELVGVLRSLDTTVKVMAVSGRSEYLRGTSVFPYEQLNAKNHWVSLCPPSIRILAKLEGSEAWPLSLTPLLQFKIAVYIEIAKMLNEKQIPARAHYEGVTIFFRGFVFELEGIHMDEARHFLGSPHGDKVVFGEKIEAIHHSYIGALVKRYSGFADGVRAAVRWVRSKGIMSDVLCQEAIELLVASVCKDSATPVYGYSMFLRFLEVLARPGTVYSVQDTKPAPDTNTLPLVVVAPYCPHSNYTKSPMLTSFAVKLLKKAAEQSLESAVDGRFSVPARLFGRMFAIPTSHWKIVLTIDRAFQAHNEYALFKDKRKAGRFEIKTHTIPDISKLLVDFDPVIAFIRELRKRYGSMMTFWYDELGGVAVGVAFDTKAIESKPADEANLDLVRLEEDGQVTVSIDLIIQQMKVIAGELVHSVERRFLIPDRQH